MDGRVKPGHDELRVRLRRSETFRDGDSDPRASNPAYVRHVLFTRGASRGRFEAEQDAAPARVFRKHTLGRRDKRSRRKLPVGSPSGLTMGLCRSRLDADRMKAEKSRRIKTHGVRPVPEVRSRGQKSLRRSVERRFAVGLSWRHDAGRALNTKARLSALLPPLFCREAAHGLKTSVNGHPRIPRGKAMTRARSAHH